MSRAAAVVAPVLLCANMLILIEVDTTNVTGPTDMPIKKFVEVIKKDLRRNNDDYADDTQNTTKINQKNLTTPKVIKSTKIVQTKSVKQNSNFNRRFNDDSYSDNEYGLRRSLIAIGVQNVTAPSIPSIKTIKHRLSNKWQPKIGWSLTTATPKRQTKKALPIFWHSNKAELRLKQNNLLKHHWAMTKSNPTVKHTFTTNTPREKKKINENGKFENFIHKNKDLLKPYVNNDANKKNLLNQIAEDNLLRNLMKELRQDIRKPEPGKPDSDLELPDPALLDMAPARGGRIHHKRLKGRLCHRHVLIPEGPKYDSKGKPYLPAHRGAGPRVRPYNTTRRPRLLLPRCCNCCKKSVLGCE